MMENIASIIIRRLPYLSHSFLFYYIIIIFHFAIKKKAFFCLYNKHKYNIHFTFLWVGLSTTSNGKHTVVTSTKQKSFYTRQAMTELYLYVCVFLEYTLTKYRENCLCHASFFCCSTQKSLCCCYCYVMNVCAIYKRRHIATFCYIYI